MTPVGNATMRLTLEITPDLEVVLRETAEREGLPPDRYVLNLLQERLEFVGELARLRNVPFPELVRQLGLIPAADA